MGFFKSFFSGKQEKPETEKQKNDQKNFEIFKYDGMRAQRMGRPDYAIKCFTEALALQEDFETMSYLSQVYIQTNALSEAHELLERMAKQEPDHTSTFLTLANVCYLQEDYQAMADAAQKAIEIEEGNAMAHYLLGRAKQGMDDGIMSIAHLTKAIVLKDDFTEARLLRAEALIKMQQYKEATEDIDAILSQDPDEEAALLLRGKVKVRKITKKAKDKGWFSDTYRAKVQWKKVKGASYYELYYTTPGNSYKYLAGTTTGTKITFARSYSHGYTGSKKVNFYVVAVKKYKNNISRSGYSKKKSYRMH